MTEQLRAALSKPNQRLTGTPLLLAKHGSLNVHVDYPRNKASSEGRPLRVKVGTRHTLFCREL